LTEIGSCQGIINKIQTTLDGGVRLTLDLNPSESDLIKKLFELKMSEEPEVCVGFAKIE